MVFRVLAVPSTDDVAGCFSSPYSAFWPSSSVTNSSFCLNFPDSRFLEILTFIFAHLALRVSKMAAASASRGKRAESNWLPAAAVRVESPCVSGKGIGMPVTEGVSARAREKRIVYCI